MSERGSLASLGDFIYWIGLLRRLQDYIDQANLKYRAAGSRRVLRVLITWRLLRSRAVGMPILLLRVHWRLRSGRYARLSIILRARNKRMRKFEENLPDAIDLFNRSMKAGHNIHAGLETIATESLGSGAHGIQESGRGAGAGLADRRSLCATSASAYR